MAQFITLPTLDPDEHEQDWLTRLTRNAQHLYMLLERCREVSLAGVLRWWPRRLAAQAADLTPVEVAKTMRELLAAGEVDIDERTGEVWRVRCIAEGLAARSPKVRVAVARAARTVVSERLRGRIAGVMQRLARENPGQGWDHPELVWLLGEAPADAGESNDEGAGGPPPVTDTLSDTVSETVSQGVSQTVSQGVSQTVSDTVPPAVSRAPFKRIKEITNPVSRSGSAKPNPVAGLLRPIPADFPVSPSMVSWALRECPEVDIATATAAFIKHNLERGNIWADPNAAWQGWMREAQRRCLEPRAGVSRRRAGAAVGVTPIPPPAAERLAQFTPREQVASPATRSRWRTGWRELIGPAALA